VKPRINSDDETVWRKQRIVGSVPSSIAGTTDSTRLDLQRYVDEGVSRCFGKGISLYRNHQGGWQGMEKLQD
jgi:hypothetical protein